MGTVIVVGAGAAGMVAAWRAAARGRRVLLLEANGRVGVKLRISGGGKCNVTHDGPVASLLAAFPKPQARFLRPALHRFSNTDVVALLHREGVRTYTRDNGRVFPLDRPGSAGEVVAAFEALLRRSGAELRTGARVLGLEGAAPRVTGLRLAGGSLPCEALVLATGGASYPETGTRGEVAGWLQALGLPVAPWFPALAPIPLAEPRPDWEGVALRDGALLLLHGPAGRRLGAFAGDVVFTRSGLSGPAALELSQAVEAARRQGAAWLAYALEPGLDVEAELVSARRDHPHLALHTWLARRLPARLAGPALEGTALDPDRRFKDLTRGEGARLRSLVEAFPLGAPGPVPLSRGEVAAGGLSLAAVDPATMRVKGWDNLYVCGELLDVDGPVGGYNLQAAFSTGFVAGESV
ncbi:MAG: aminoacetone oxidase family FAD-binding enzyme [Holophagaceae bacterium]